jgi:hypothetical protein
MKDYYWSSQELLKERGERTAFYSYDAGQVNFHKSWYVVNSGRESVGERFNSPANP